MKKGVLYLVLVILVSSIVYSAPIAPSSPGGISGPGTIGGATGPGTIGGPSAPGTPGTTTNTCFSGDGICVQGCFPIDTDCFMTPGCFDFDTDGYGMGCTNGLDCNDANSAVNPSATESCTDTIDNNCNGVANEGCGGVSCTDADSDTFGIGCVAGLDCNDANSAVNPSATEICDSIDNDCDTSVDEGGVCSLSCVDSDSDTYGDNCAAGLDCNDANSAVNPSVTEICDSVDNNCNGVVDEGCSGVVCVDSDSDTYGSGCSAGLDCDDTNAAINPSALELCTDTVDNNCNGIANEGCVGICTDVDLDGYGTGCPAGLDCDDTNPLIHPGAPEICTDSVDNNCVGGINEISICASTGGSTGGNTGSSTSSGGSSGGGSASNSGFPGFCYNGRKDVREDGLDCGGLCVKQCSTAVIPSETISQNIIPTVPTIGVPPGSADEDKSVVPVLVGGLLLLSGLGGVAYYFVHKHIVSGAIGAAKVGSTAFEVAQRYVQNYMKMGYDQKDIAGQMLKSGWQQKDIDNVFSQINK